MTVSGPGPKVKLKLTIAYDGRSFRGWQSQAGKDAVQDHLEAALEKLCGYRVVVHGSGRTDAGVHALGQSAHINVPADKFDPRTWMLGINARLPQEVRVMKVVRVPLEFHARFHAEGKVYLYRIWNGSSMHPLEIGRAWHVPVKLDLDLLKEAAACLTGTHDFASFAANRGTPDEDTVRTIYSIKLSRRGSLLALRFHGDGFLYRMVRLLTGSMVRCAQGREPIDWLRKFLKSKGTTKTHFLAAAEGLYLERVIYPKNLKGLSNKEPA